MKKILKYTAALLLIIVVAAAGFYNIWFLRQPKRNIPGNEHLFVSPANGQVVSITKWNAAMLTVLKKEDGFINLWTKDVDTAGTMISIQMTPMHVHYQRAPLAATVLAHRHEAGDFNNAINMSNEYGIRHENEHNEILFTTNNGLRFKVIQIAGFVARRIEDYVKEKQQVKQGEVIGLIKLGSQVTILLPHGVDVNVHKGETVIDGETVLATIPQVTP
ncbi:MAG: phosphatidylserine decarboxylase [Chitinophagales bacterium]